MFSRKLLSTKAIVKTFRARREFQRRWVGVVVKIIGSRLCPWRPVANACKEKLLSHYEFYTIPARAFSLMSDFQIKITRNMYVRWLVC